jgi:hypothetical protein
LSVGLGLIGIGEKMFKTFNSKLSALLGFGNAASCGRILLKKLYACCFVIGVLVPCAVESFAAEAKKYAEFVNGNFVGGESLNKDVGGVGVGVAQGAQCVGKGSAKSCSSVGLTNLKVVTPANVTNKTGQRNSPSDRIEISDDKFNHWWLVYMVIALSPLYFANVSVTQSTPNAELRGAQRSGASL